MAADTEGWQPIESAPTDQTAVLIAVPLDDGAWAVPIAGFAARCQRLGVSLSTSLPPPTAPYLRDRESSRRSYA